MSTPEDEVLRRGAPEDDYDDEDDACQSQTSARGRGRSTCPTTDPAAGGRPLTLVIDRKILQSMTTTVTDQALVAIPPEVQRQLGIRPGDRLAWEPVEGGVAVLVRVMPSRGERAKKLLGAGRLHSPERDAVAELIAERAAEG